MDYLVGGVIWLVCFILVLSGFIVFLVPFIEYDVCEVFDGYL